MENVSMWQEKILYCSKRNKENNGHIIQNLVILSREF